jgi:hypothetical protein
MLTPRRASATANGSRPSGSVSALPAERVFRSHPRPAEDAELGLHALWRHWVGAGRRGASRAWRWRCGSPWRFQVIRRWRGRQRSVASRWPLWPPWWGGSLRVEHRPALRARRLVGADLRPADRAHEPAKDRAAFPKPQVASGLEPDLPTRVEREVAFRLELKVPLWVERQIPVRVELQYFGHLYPSSRSPRHALWRRPILSVMGMSTGVPTRRHASPLSRCSTRPACTCAPRSP